MGCIAENVNNSLDQNKMKTIGKQQKYRIMKKLYMTLREIEKERNKKDKKESMKKNCKILGQWEISKN